MTIQLGMFALETPTMNKLDVSRCVVKPVNYKTASRFCNEYHYAGRTPSIVVSLGLYVDDVMAGVITYGIPPNRNALGFCGEEYISNALELNRLYIHDWAGRNSESFLIGQSFKYLEKFKLEYFLLISYADPVHDHLGIIYQATNWLYTGKGGTGKSDVIVNGELISEKHLYNRYGTHKRDVLKNEFNLEIVDIIAPGKHRYVYFLGDRRQRRKMKAKLKWHILPYPKREPQKSTTTLTS